MLFWLFYGCFYILKILLIKCWRTKSVYIYIFDVVTDLIAAYGHYVHGDIMYAFLTIVIALLPMICLGIVNTYCIIQRSMGSIWCKGLNYSTSKVFVVNPNVNGVDSQISTKSMVQGLTCTPIMETAVEGQPLQDVVENTSVQGNGVCKSLQGVVENQSVHELTESPMVQNTGENDLCPNQLKRSRGSIGCKGLNYSTSKVFVVNPTVKGVDRSQISTESMVQGLTWNPITKTAVESQPLQDIVEKPVVPDNVKCKSLQEVVENQSVHDLFENMTVQNTGENGLCPYQLKSKEVIMCSIEKEIVNTSVNQDLVENPTAEKLVDSYSVQCNIENVAVKWVSKSQSIRESVESTTVHEEAESSSLQMIVEKPKDVLEIPTLQDLTKESPKQEPWFMWSKCSLTIGSIIITPFMPLLHLLHEVVVIPIDYNDKIEYIKSSQTEEVEEFINLVLSFIFKPLDILFTKPYIQKMMISFSIVVGNGPDDAALNAGLVKLLDVMLESLLQGKLQLYIIAQKYNLAGVDDRKLDDLADVNVTAWQWTSAAMSLTSIAYGISSNQYLFQNGTIGKKSVMFLFGLMNITSRIFVCCLYSMELKYLMLLPFSLELVLSIVVWLYNKGISGLRGNDIFGLIIIFLSWIVTAIFDCFTLSAIPASIANMIFAALLTVFSSKLTLHATIIANVLSAVCLVFNVVMVVVPKFKQNFEEQFMNRNTHQLLREEIESKEFLLKYSTAEDVYVRPIKSSDPYMKGWREGVYGIIGNVSREKDSSLVYLTPKLSSSTSTGIATIRWRVSWRGSSCLAVKNVTVNLPSTTHLNPNVSSNVTFYVVVGHKKFHANEDGHDPMCSIHDDEVVRQEGKLHLSENQLAGIGPVRHMDVVATMEGRWHAQLFLQDHTNTTEYPFLIRIKFK